jgi:hypothetical protein
MARRHALSWWPQVAKDATATRGAVTPAELAHHALAMPDAAIARLHAHDADARLPAGEPGIDAVAGMMRERAGRPPT